MNLLELKDVEVTYRRGSTKVHAVRGVSLTVQAGETLAVVGESGCGKSSTGRVAAGLHHPTAGTVKLEGQALDAHSGAGIQMVFQHPDQSLDPVWTVGRSVAEPFVRARLGDRGKRRAAVVSALERVGLGAEYLARKPRELSGGQAQRVAIARALIAEPRLLVLDEPTASLDQSVRARLLATLSEVQQETSIGYLFITHDLASVRRLAHRVVVMYLGEIVEVGETDTVLSRPEHPYTRALLLASPPLDRRQPWSMQTLPGETPSASTIPVGCPFRGRCSEAIDECAVVHPGLFALTPTHSAACLLAPRDPSLSSVGQSSRA